MEDFQSEMQNLETDNKTQSELEKLNNTRGSRILLSKHHFFKGHNLNTLFSGFGSLTDSHTLNTIVQIINILLSISNEPQDSIAPAVLPAIPVEVELTDGEDIKIKQLKAKGNHFNLKQNLAVKQNKME